MSTSGTCTVTDEYYCSNYENAETSYDYDTAADCYAACDEDTSCSGGYYYSDASACLLFGTDNAEDDDCEDMSYCGESCTAFKCSSKLPRSAWSE